MLITDTIPNTVWIVQSGPSVNPVPPDAYIPTPLPTGALKVTNVSSKPFGGALVTAKRIVPIIPGVSLPYFGLDMLLYISSFDLPTLGRLEIDVKVATPAAPSSTTPIANIANGSSQLNMSTGQWQIDTSPPGWINTGFAPILTPDVWMPLSFRYMYGNGKYSVLSCAFGEQRFTVPSSLQGLPMQMSNWAQVAAVQLQTEVMQPGGLSTIYNQIELSWSDQPF
jgi:hypothetical protein